MENNQTLHAILWMLGAMFSLFLVGLMGKFLSTHYNTFEIMFYRSMIAFPLLCSFMWAMGHFNGFGIASLKLHLVRNIAHFTAQNLWFYAIATLPLAVVITFEFTTPSWVIIISALALGEGFGWRRALVIMLSLFGIMLITDPRHVQIGWPLMTAVLCAMGFASTMILTKRLTRTQNAYQILFMMTMMQTIFAGAIILTIGELTPPIRAFAPHMLCIAIFGTTSHYCMTRALSLAEASLVSPIDLLRLPLSVLAGWWLFAENITWLMFAGTLLLVLANYVNIRRKA